MKLVSVNVGKPREIEGAGKSGVTGIFKEPQDGPVYVGKLGLLGDEISDTENHGGRDQAVYVFSTDDYDWWSDEVGYTLEPGTFGENLTISGLESAASDIGDRLHFAEVVLEVTGPRIPCGTISARMGDRLFVKKFRAAERPGVYCRVIREGRVTSGEEVRLEPYSGDLDPPLGVIEDFREFFEPRHTEETLLRHLAAPIAVRDRDHKEKLLAGLRGGQAGPDIVG